MDTLGHAAAARLNLTMVDWLVSTARTECQGRNWTEQTPLDSAAHWMKVKARNPAMSRTGSCRRAPNDTVVRRGAGDADGFGPDMRRLVVNPIEGDGGMLRIAA